MPALGKWRVASWSEDPLQIPHGNDRGYFPKLCHRCFLSSLSLSRSIFEKLAFKQTLGNRLSRFQGELPNLTSLRTAFIERASHMEVQMRNDLIGVDTVVLSHRDS